MARGPSWKPIGLRLKVRVPFKCSGCGRERMLEYRDNMPTIGMIPACQRCGGQLVMMCYHRAEVNVRRKISMQGRRLNK